MASRGGQILAICGVLGALAGAPAAHVAPSARENNRYLVLAPLGDRLRLVYVVYMGEEPGRRARARMDRDGDRTISDAESAAWAGALAAEVAAGLSLEVDGVPVPVAWSEIDVGLGDPAAGAGSFAVDLVLWRCFDRPRERTTHQIRFADRFKISDPGETELRAEESPGVIVTRSDFGQPQGTGRPRLDFKWLGGAGPASTGYHLDVAVDPALAAFSTEPCPTAASSTGSRRLWPWIAAVAALLLVAAVLAWRRKAKRPGT
jgi:hypothetical protein